MGNKKVLVQARGITRSKERIREENELIILIAAEKVFAKHGLKGSTTKQIADMAKLPKSNIHYYFHTKLNLYRCVLESILVDWMRAADTFNKFDEPREALKYYVGAKMNIGFFAAPPLYVQPTAGRASHGQNEQNRRTQEVQAF